MKNYCRLHLIYFIHLMSLDVIDNHNRNLNKRKDTLIPQSQIQIESISSEVYTIRQDSYTWRI